MLRLTSHLLVFRASIRCQVLSGSFAGCWQPSATAPLVGWTSAVVIQLGNESLSFGSLMAVYVLSCCVW